MGEMACSNCAREITERDRFCPWCGAPNTSSRPPASTGPAPDAAASPDDELRQLRHAVDSMTADLAQLRLRLSNLERRSGSPPAPPRQPVPQSPAQQQPPAAATPAAAVPAAPTTPTPPPAPAGPASAIPATPMGGLTDRNWEWLLGGNWLARIGIVALIFGVAFFISLAIDRGWLNETARVLLGVAGGLVLIAAGEYFRNRFGAWAQTVAGGGIAILYLSVYGAFALYVLIPTELAFGAFAIITLAGALLSLRHEAVGVAVLAIFGGFATPLLLQDELPDQRLLLLYVLVLDVGVLALAGFRNWRWFTLLAWAGSLILFGFWQMEIDPSTALAQIGITAIFLVFVAATVAFHLVRKQAVGPADLALVTLNAAGYYGISYALMNDPYDDWMGGFTALVAVFYVALGAACRLRGPEQLNLTLFSAGIAVVLAILAVPIQFGGPWISLAWGVEGLVLLFLSFPLRMRELRWAGYAMFVVNALWLLTRDTPDALSEEFTPFLNQYMISYAASIVLPVLAAIYLHLRRADLEPGEEKAIPLFAIRAAIFAAAVIPVQVDGVWIPIAWAVEALLALALAVRLRMPELRLFGFGLLAAMLVRLVGIDTFDVDASTFRPVANLRFLAFAVGIAALYVAGWMAFRYRNEDGPPSTSTDEGTTSLVSADEGTISPASADDETTSHIASGESTTSRIARLDSQFAFTVLLAIANLLTLWLLSWEVVASADSDFFALSRDASENVASLGLSLLWAIYAAVLLVLGVARRLRWVRIAGLALLALPVVKLFVYDSQTLEQEYRVIAFIALGLLLLAGGLLYQRYSRAVRGFLFEE